MTAVRSLMLRFAVPDRQTKTGIDPSVANCSRPHSRNVRSCLASLENALKAGVDAVIASALAFVPDLLPITVRGSRSNRLIASRFVRLHFHETTTCVFSIRWRLTPSRSFPVR